SIDAVRHGVNGLTVDGTSADAIARAILLLLEDEALYLRLQQGGQTAARTADWNSRAQQFGELCQRLAAPRNKAASAAMRGSTKAASPSLPQPGTIVEFDAAERPYLLVIVDAEEEFDWNTISAAATSVTTIQHQHRAQRIFERFGVVPTYAVDFPVASQEA